MRAAFEAARLFNETRLTGTSAMRSMLAVVRMPLMACLTSTLALLGAVHAQTTISPPTGQKSLAATLNVYAFPGAGQVPTQQAQDETECYNWAVNDPGKGAAIGAGVGAIGNRARATSQANQATQQSQQAQKAAAKMSAEQMTAFKKAFSACLE